LKKAAFLVCRAASLLATTAKASLGLLGVSPQSRVRLGLALSSLITLFWANQAAKGGFYKRPAADHGQQPARPGHLLLRMLEGFAFSKGDVLVILGGFLGGELPGLRLPSGPSSLNLLAA
jgi:hypothetical protein